MSDANGAGASKARPESSTILRTSEKPFEWTPEEGEPEQHVAGRDIGARQQLGALYRADGEAGEVIVARLVHAGHFGRLAADQRRAGDPAAFGDAADHLGRLDRIELAGREIVEKEQRLGALHDKIVDAHRDEIDPDRVVDARVDGDLELGADAVIGRDEQRIGIAGRLQVEYPAEPADIGIGARPARCLDERLDQVDEPVAGVNVDTRIGIAERVGGGFLGHRRFPLQ